MSDDKEKRTKKVEGLLVKSGIFSIIIMAAGWILLPIISESLTLSGLSFFVVMTILVIALMVKITTDKKMHKVLVSDARSFFLTMLFILSAITSVFFMVLSFYATLGLLFSGDITDISSALKVISLAFLSAYFFSLYLNYYLVGTEKPEGKSQKDGDLDSKESDRSAESLKHSYFGSIFIIFNILFTSCVFQGIIVMKNQTGFFKWFSEIFNVLKTGSDLYREFSLEPVGLNTFSNMYELLKSDITPVILAGAALVSMFIVPLLSLSIEKFKELKRMLNGAKSKAIEPMKKWTNPPTPDTGYCVECKENVKLVQFVLHNRGGNIQIGEDYIIDGAVQKINDKMIKKGVRFDVEKYEATYLKYGTVVHDRMDNELNTIYACSKCYLTVYKDFLGNRYANGKNITHVKIIGGRNTGKSCFIVSVFNDYRDTVMINGTPEYKYFFDMWQNLQTENGRGRAPESTNGNVLSSPVLTIKYKSSYICLTDIAGEHDNITVAAEAVKKDDVVALLVDVGNVNSIREAASVLARMINNLKKVVICITKIDKYPEYDCMEANVADVKSGKVFIDNVINSKLAKRLRKSLKSMSYEEEGITKAFLEVLKNNTEFMALYRAAFGKTGKVSIVAHAGLGTGTDTNYTLSGNYNPKYIKETINTFIS